MQRFTKKSFLTSAFCVIILALIAAVCTQTDFNNPVDRSGDNFTCPEWFEYGHSCEPPTNAVFTLTTNALPSNVGFVDPPAVTSHDSGTVITVTAAAAVDHRFAGWSGALPDSIDPTSEVITFVMNRNITLIANITGGENGEHSLTVNAHPQSGGSVSPTGTTEHPNGTMITVTATPNEGYEFVEWTGDLRSTDPEITFSINSDMMLAANFCEIGSECGIVYGSCTNLATHDCENNVAREDCGVGFSFAANEGCPTVNHVTVINGTTSRATYRANETVIIEADPAPEGKLFIGWTTESNGVVFANNNSTITMFTMPDNGVEVIANYGDVPPPDIFGRCIDRGECTNNVESRNCGGVFNESTQCPILYTVTVTRGTTSRGLSVDRYEAGQSVTITANAAPVNEAFINWADGVTFANANSMTTSFTMPANDVTITANFGCIRGTNCPDDLGSCRVSSTCTTVVRNICNGVFSAMESANFSPCPRTEEVTVHDGSPSHARHQLGDTVRIIANAAPAGQQFTGWTTASSGVTFRPNDGSQNAWFIMPANSVTVRANYKHVYTLTVGRDPTAGGNVNVNGTNNPTPTEYIEGSPIVVTAVENANYDFVNWTLVSGTLPQGFSLTDRTNTFNINGNVNIRANFVQTFTLDVGRNVAERGNVRVNGANNPPQSTHRSGTRIGIRATPVNTNFVFDRWTAVTGSLPSGITATSDTITFNINSNVNIMANFLPRYTVLVSRNQTTWGDVNVNPPNVNNPTTSSTHTEGTQITITATPRSGYGFVNWTAVSGSLPSCIVATNPSNTCNINSNINIRANFDFIRTLTTAANPTAGGNVTVTPPPSHTPNGYLNGTSVTVTANANAGYRFNNWTHVSGTLPTGFSLTNPTNTFNINANVSIRANFVRQFTLTVNAGTGGTTTPSGSTLYDSSTTVNVCATAAANHLFTRWSGASTSENTCVSINMTVNRTLTANFMQGFVDARDGQRYRTVRIGSHTWMAQNLNFNATGSLCYNNLTANCATYGRLYDWNTALNACPAGWRLPTNPDGGNLLSAAGGSYTQVDDRHGIWPPSTAMVLKSQTGWANNTNGTDALGFSALPGGMYWHGHPGNGFVNIGTRGYWWINDEIGPYHALHLHMRDSPHVFVIWDSGKDGHFSVRCVQN